MNILQKFVFYSLCMGVFAPVTKKNYNFQAFDAVIFNKYKKDYGTILIMDDFNLNSIWFPLHKQSYSVVFCKESMQCSETCFDRKKVDAILITTIYTKRLRRILGRLYEKTWWSVMIPIYVLNLPQNNCKIAMDISWILWLNKVLTSYYFCIENSKVQIYTYNPFINRAPSNWTEIRRSPREPNWTLYQQQYHPRIIYGELDFDRTQYLDGYQMTIAIPTITKKGLSLVGQHISYENFSRSWFITDRRYSFIIDALVMKLNVRPSLYVIKKADDIGTVSEKYVNYIIRTSSIVPLHLILTDYYLLNKTLKNGGVTQTYPLAWYENGIAAYDRGYRTFAEKIWNFYGIWTILYTILVLLITFVVIWFTESRKTAFAVFEIIRLFISQGLYTRMNTLPLRIFFITILIYFLIIQATFNGHLAKFLTKPELRKHPETREDLRDMNCSIYDTKYVREHLAKTNKEKLIYQAQVFMCLDHIWYNDSSVACIFDHNQLYKYSQLLKGQSFYISKRPSETLYSTFFIKDYWPLSKRVNMVILSLGEFGFLEVFLGHKESQLMHNLTVAEARSKKDFEPIKLENLTFAFLILGIGLIGAGLSFGVEIVITQIRIRLL